MKNTDITQKEVEKHLGQKLAADSSTESFREAYDEFHTYLLHQGIRGQNPSGFLYKEKLSILDKILMKNIGRSKKVLDIGCGDGTLAIACAGTGNEVVGLDVSEVAIAQAKSNKSESIKASFLLADARDMQGFQNESFDIAVSKDVIEHLPEKDLKPHLMEVYRVLKQNGRYLLFTPSKVLGDLSLGAHLKMYGLQDLIPTLRQINFTVSVICPFPEVLGVSGKITNRWLVESIVRYEKMLGRIGVGGCLAKLGNLSYGIIPMVLLSAVKKP